MLTIRRATENDVERVHHLIETLEAPQVFAFEPFRRTYLKNLTDPDLYYLVAELDGVVATFGSLAVSRPLHHDAPVAEIVELIVDEQCRGRSVGKQLVDEMFKLAQGRGCCCMEVASNRMRTRAHQFYAKCGFTLTHYKLTMNMEIKAD